MKEFNNILQISGSGRNCGKTTLACNIIGKLANEGKVFGLKITPHFHHTGSNQKLIGEGVGYKIFRETDKNSNKDSSRMLKAGAKEVYFIQCTDSILPEIYDELKTMIPTNSPIICESGSFANVFKPGLHLLVKGINADNSKKSYISNLKKADLIITPDEFSPRSLNFNIENSKMHWTINTKHND